MDVAHAGAADYTGHAAADTAATDTAATDTAAPDTVIIDPTLSDDHSLSILTVNGRRIITLTPQRAEQLAIAPGATVTAEQLASITLNDPDHVFYLPLDEQAMLTAEATPSTTRQLGADDADAFERFAAEAPDDDLDEAFVELDHWLVFGTFENGDRLVAAASMYPWALSTGSSAFADLGVITLPEFRGQGKARATVRAMSARALELGYEPQYRCQLDNAASIALARKAGFALFGDWQVIVEG